jgi:hypothetical protein
MNLPDYWHQRAKLARDEADKAGDKKVRRMLLGFADGYDKIAKRIEKLAGKS